MPRKKEEILNEMLKSMPAEYDKTVGSPFYEMQAPTAAEIEKLEADEEKILNNAFFETADIEHKEIIAKERANIVRRPATRSSGKVKIVGEVNAIVKKGTKVATETYTFTVEETKVIGEGGNVEVKATCDTFGSVGNVPRGAINNFPITIQGLAEVTNEEAFSNGYDIESIENFGNRYYEKIRNPASSGNVEHYKQWAKEVSGVGGVKVFGRTPTRGSVTITIINDSGRAADTELCEKVKNHVDESRPVGANVVIKTATELKVDVNLKVRGQGTTEKIKRNLENFIKSQAFKTEYISYARLGEKILDTEGVLDYENLTVNGNKTNVKVGVEEVAVLGVVQIEEIT